jgi:hypothetical protein
MINYKRPIAQNLGSEKGGARQWAVLIRERRLPRRQGQTISLDEHAVVFGLRPSKKADKHEGSAKHQPYQHNPTVRAFVVKIHDTPIHGPAGLKRCFGGVALDPDRAMQPV